MVDGPAGVSGNTTRGLFIEQLPYVCSNSIKGISLEMDEIVAITLSKQKLILSVFAKISRESGLLVVNTVKVGDWQCWRIRRVG